MRRRLGDEVAEVVRIMLLHIMYRIDLKPLQQERSRQMKERIGVSYTTQLQCLFGAHVSSV